MNIDHRAAPMAPHAAQAPVSKLVMSDRLIRLAEEADRAGYTRMAHTLVDLACAVFDEPSPPVH